jgi:peptide/nickel transport system permease protein
VLRTIGVKLLLLVPILLFVSFGTFMLVELVPGDPAVQVLGPNSTADDYYRVRTELGLDRPLMERYGDWLGNAVTGDFGKNLVTPTFEVSTWLSRAFPVSVELALLAMLMSVVIAIPAALWSAYRQGGAFDRVASATAFGLISIPSFVSGLLLILMFVIRFRWFETTWVRPSDGGWFANLKTAFLPSLTLALTEVAVFTRVLRGDMISTLQEDYVLAARAKGMPTRHLLFREALRPSSFSLITIAGVSLGRLIGGSLIVEYLFGPPGVGKVIIDAATKSDFPLVQAGVLIIATAYVLLNMGVDVLYGYLDPRIRRARS